MEPFAPWASAGLTSTKGSWTILVTTADGTTCMVATGENWETLPKLAMGPKA